MKNKIKDIPPLPRIIDMNDNYLKGYISCLTIMETDAACELSTKENQICNLFNESLETINESDIAKAWEFKYSEHTLPKLAKQLAIIYLEEEIKDKNRWFSLINTVPDVK